MLGVLGAILGIVPSITEIGKQIAAAQLAREQAKTDRERLAAEERIEALKLQAQVAVAASKNDKWWSTRELIGKCVLLYVAKIVVWDTVLGWGVTPDPGQQVTWIVMTVIGFYFVSRMFQR